MEKNITYIIFVLVVCLYGICESQNLQQIKADLAQGGRKVCPYCHYCVYKSYCPCSAYTECDLCQYRTHCDTTCTNLCQTADPCGTGNPCSVNETCREDPVGTANCVCKLGHVCPEDPKCVAKANNGECDFYKCFDDRKNCGPAGYPLNYGYKYCTRFGDYQNEFTPDGQAMIDCVRKCLTKALLGHYQTNDPAGQSCDQIKATAFNSHVQCYYNCDFCHVWSHNKLALYHVYDYSDFFSGQALKQVLDVGAKCAATTYHDIENWVNSTFRKVTDVIG